MDANSPLDALENPGLLRTQALINGEWVVGAETFAVTDPATGRELAQVPNLGRADVESAIAAAANALGAEVVGRLNSYVKSKIDALEDNLAYDDAQLDAVEQRLRHPQAANQVAHRLFMPREHFDDSSPSGLGDRVEDI